MRLEDAPVRRVVPAGDAEVTGNYGHRTLLCFGRFYVVVLAAVVRNGTPHRSRDHVFATAPSHGQGLFVISEHMARPSAEAALCLRVDQSMAATVAVGIGHALGRYRRRTDRIRSAYRRPQVEEHAAVLCLVPVSRDVSCAQDARRTVVAFLAAGGGGKKARFPP